jgi:Phosphofructokinase
VGSKKVRQTFADLALDGLIAIGGEGTLGAAAHMSEEGMSVIGVPKTIDNDLSGLKPASGSARPFRSPPTLSTGCTAPPRVTTASSWRS